MENLEYKNRELKKMLVIIIVLTMFFIVINLANDIQRARQIEQQKEEIYEKNIEIVDLKEKVHNLENNK